MEISRLINLGGSVKIETTADDLFRFAEYILERYTNEQRVENKLPEFGGIDLAVEITGYSKSSLYTFVSKSQIPYLKKHGKLWFKRSSLISWLESSHKNDKLSKYLK